MPDSTLNSSLQNVVCNKYVKEEVSFSFAYAAFVFWYSRVNIISR